MVGKRQVRARQLLTARNPLLGEGNHGGIVQHGQSAVGRGCIFGISGCARDNASIRENHKLHTGRQPIARRRALFRKGIRDAHRKTVDRFGGCRAGPLGVGHLKSACRVKMRNREVRAGQFGRSLYRTFTHRYGRGVIHHVSHAAVNAAVHGSLGEGGVQLRVQPESKR